VGRLVGRLLRALVGPAALALAALAAAQTLAPGQPPLTQQMVDRVTGLLGEVVGKPLSAQQRERMRAVYVGHWQARAADQMETLQALDQLAQTLPRATPAQRAQVLQDLRAQLIPALRMAAERDPDARWLLELHDEAQRTAQGAARPPATVPTVPTAPTSPATPSASPAFPSPASPAAPATVAAAAPSTVAPAPPRPPLAAPGAPGLQFTAPPGWALERHASGTVIFRRTFTGNPEVTHHGTMMLFPPQAAPQGPAAAFESEWRGRFGGADGHPLGDAVPHFRRRLPGGPVAYYMGVRTYKLIDGTDTQFYLALWMVDLLDGRTQTVALNMQLGRMRMSTGNMNLDDAFAQFVPAVAPLLDSLRYPDDRAPGALVARDEVVGQWRQSSAAFGGQYVNTATGQSAGMLFASSGGVLQLGADGRYFMRFSSAHHNPVAGGGGVSQSRHAGRWALQQQTLALTPDTALGYNPSEVAVGAGVVRTAQGPRRMLITVGLSGNGQFNPPRWFPLWDTHDGVMNWYTEER
jgi:hypothetical protein